jgi:hypothetical protein
MRPTEAMRYALITLFLVGPAIALAQDRPQLTWEGDVAGSATLYIQGDRVDVQGRDTGAVDRPRYRFNNPLPASRQRATMDVRRGRGRVEILEQPTPNNEFSLIVRIDPVGNRLERYVLDFFWDEDRQSNTRSRQRDDRIGTRGRADDNFGSGSVTWSGQVDHEAIVEFRSRRAVVRTLRGRPVVGDRADFSSAMPRGNFNVRLEDASGRGRVELLGQPSADNNYAALVRIYDEEGGAGDYSFRLSWDGGDGSYSSNDSYRPINPSSGGILTPGGGLSGGSYTGAQVMRWSGRVDGTVRITFRDGRIYSTRVSGGPIQGERADVGSPLPRREVSDIDVRKLRGRGDVDVIQRPDSRNGYTLIVEIEDDDGGSDDYDLEVTWR